MAWTNLTFPFGSTLTASKMNALQNNFTAFAERQTNECPQDGQKRTGCSLIIGMA